MSTDRVTILSISPRLMLAHHHLPLLPSLYGVAGMKALSRRQKDRTILTVTLLNVNKPMVNYFFLRNCMTSIHTNINHNATSDSEFCQRSLDLRHSQKCIHHYFDWQNICQIYNIVYNTPPWQNWPRLSADKKVHWQSPNLLHTGIPLTWPCFCPNELRQVKKLEIVSVVCTFNSANYRNNF